VTREKFDAIWMPRLGEEGTAELWRFRRRGIAATCATPIAGVGSLLLSAGGVLADLAGGLLVLTSAVLLIQFVRGRGRLKALMSQRFGVRVKGFPLINRRSFDRWCADHGYSQPGR
jgi:hypothetical protein